MNGTRIDIECYHNELINGLRYLYYYEGNQLSSTEKQKFFESVRQSFGRTALVLSGGANFSIYHNGVIKALYESDLMPSVICGCSAGSIFAAGICCLKRNEQGLASNFDIACAYKQIKWTSDNVFGLIKRFLEGK